MVQCGLPFHCGIPHTLTVSGAASYSGYLEHGSSLYDAQKVKIIKNDQTSLSSEIGKKKNCCFNLKTHTLYCRAIGWCGWQASTIRRAIAGKMWRIWKIFANLFKIANFFFKLQKITENCLPVRHLIIIKWSEIHFLTPSKAAQTKPPNTFWVNGSE